MLIYHTTPVHCLCNRRLNVYCICRLSYYLFLTKIFMEYLWTVSEVIHYRFRSWFAVCVYTWLDAQQQTLCFAARESASKPRCCKHRGEARLRLHPLGQSDSLCSVLVLFLPVPAGSSLYGQAGTKWGNEVFWGRKVQKEKSEKTRRKTTGIREQ